MAVMRKPTDQLPKDAVILTETEALEHQATLIRDWNKPGDVWALRSGIGILAFAASGAGWYINSHYRRKLKLHRIGLLSSYLPMVVLPGMMSTLVHKLFVTHDIFIEKTRCPLCLQARAAALQVGVGFAYPLILAPLGSFMYATRHATYRLPDITRDFVGVLRIIKKFTLPIGTQLSFIFVGQALIATWFTYLEAKSYYKVKEKMLKIEEEWEKRQGNIL